MDPYTAPGAQPRQDDVLKHALYIARQLKKPTDWATFTLEDIEAILEHARQEGRSQGAEQERARIGAAMNAKSLDVARVVRAAGLSAEAAERAVTEIKRWADAITRGEWSSEEVDDG